MSSPESTMRRSLLGKIWVGLGGLALLEGVWVVTDFLKPRRRQHDDEEAATLIVAGPIENFDPGSVTAFQQGKFYLARLQDGGFLALHRECTHLGCTVPWIGAEERFVCPCHASVFDIKGQVLSPPAPRPLDTFAVRIENGIVKVDTSQPIKRNTFSDNQVARS
ncbi:MAG: Rieske (2Fe-2S) protein [Acidobacteriota bacterium]